MSENLKTDYGMLAFSADAGSRANISPFISGFHLEVGYNDNLRIETVDLSLTSGATRVGYA